MPPKNLPFCAESDADNDNDAPTLVDGRRSQSQRIVSNVRATSLFHREHPEGRYQVIKLLGEGANGRVYAAFDRDLGREVALKTMAATEPAQRDRFEREARVTAGLAHPSIPQLYEAGESDGALYLSMQRAQGLSLASLIRTAMNAGSSQAMAIDDLVEMMLKLCDAVAYAHDRGIVHCDIKPHNVMIGVHGEVTLIDWGAARHLDSRPAAGRSRIGTPAYMAPEQATGAAPSPATDIYALGATLFHALLLRKPLRQRSTEAFWAAKQRGELDQPNADELLSVPRPLLGIALKALSREPRDRYPNVADLAQALRDFRAGRAAWAAPIVNQRFTSDAYQHNWQAVPAGSFERRDEKLVSAARQGCLLVYKQRLSAGVAVEFEGEILEGFRPGDLSVVWTEDDVLDPEPHWPKRGSCWTLQIGAFDNLSVGIYRDFVQCLAGHSRSVEIGRRYTVRAEIDERRLRLLLDGELIAEYEELFPFTSGYVAVFCYRPGKAISNIRLYERGVPERIAPTAIGDAFFARGDYQPAASQYARVEQLLPRTELAEEARFKRGLSLLRDHKTEQALDVWAGLRGEAWVARAALHGVDVAFNAGRHEEVVAELSQLLKTSPCVRASVVNRWVQYVTTLCGSDYRPLDLYAPLRDEHFANHVESAAGAAALEMARGNFREVLERYPDQHIQFVQACMALGEYQRIIDRYPRVGWVRDLALLALNQFDDENLEDWSRKLSAPLRGDLSGTENTNSTEALLATGRFERLFSLDYAKPEDLCAALRGLSRGEEAAERGDARALAELGVDESASSRALVLEERLYLLHHLALTAFARGDLDAYRRKRDDANRLPCSAGWGDVWLHRYFLLPIVDERLGEAGAVERAARQLIAERSSHFNARGLHLARFVLGECTLEAFEAQPCRLQMRGRALFARALRAEFERDDLTASARYAEYSRLPRNERTADSVRLDPVCDAWARFRSG